MHGMVTRNQRTRIGQLTANLRQAYGQHFRVRQDAFAHALSKGVLLDLHQMLKEFVVFKVRLRVNAQQIGGRDHAFEGDQLAVLDFFLQSATRHTRQTGRA